MTFYVALDVGLRMVSLFIVDEAGGVKLEKSLPSEIEDIVACLRDFGEEIARVGLEAGTLAALGRLLQSDLPPLTSLKSALGVEVEKQIVPAVSDEPDRARRWPRRCCRSNGSKKRAPWKSRSGG